VLVAWGFTEQGERVLLSVMLGMREAHEDWLALGRDLIARGLGAPLLIVADGAPGLIKAIEQCWPGSDRQRCCVHRARNLYAKLPERERSGPSRPTGRRSMTRSATATQSSDCKRWSASSTRAATPPLPNAWPTTSTRSSCTCATHPDTGADGAQPTCSKRSLGEVKRRTKVMGRFPGEESCLSLVWAVLDLLITHETNGIRFNQLDRQRLKRIRYRDADQATPEEVTAA
jgi:putative transposase